jgi:predicted RNase H-like HicB family nuclease
LHVRVILEPSEDDGSTVRVPTLPGCISEDGDPDEALADVREAIQLYLEPVEDDMTLADGEVVEIAV